MNKWIFLSYPLSSHLSGYGNGERIVVQQIRSIKNGYTSNNSRFCMPMHFGTHIDFPYHFSNQGKTINNYSPDFFIFNHVLLINLQTGFKTSNYLIETGHIVKAIKNQPKNTEVILIKTGFSGRRGFEDYWKYGYGIGLGVAKLLKEYFPSLRGIGFDLISLNSYQQRAIGRKAHKEFLIENDILIIEDMNLSPLEPDTEITQLIVSPLIINKSDAAPVTVFAKIID